MTPVSEASATQKLIKNSTLCCIRFDHLSNVEKVETFNDYSAEFS